MLLKYAARYDSGAYSFEYVESMSKPKGEHLLDPRLALDYHSFQVVKEKLGNSDPMRIYIDATLLSRGGHQLAHHTLLIEPQKQNWILAQVEDGKAKPTGIFPEHQGTLLLDEKTAKLHQELARLKDDILGDQILNLQKQVFEAQVRNITDHV